ncbi:MAG: MoaD/ThiS family protein [Infirmifilum sp.]
MLMADYCKDGFKVLVEKFGRETFEICMNNGATVRDLLRKLGLAESEVVVAVNGEVVAEDEGLVPHVKVTIHSVVSGG